MVVNSTPSPRAKTAKNGYTILCMVFRMVRRNMKIMSWKRRRINIICQCEWHLSATRIDAYSDIGFKNTRVKK